MTSIFRIDYRNGLDGILGRISTFQNDVGMWLDEKPACGAPQDGPGSNAAVVREGVPDVGLLLEIPLTPRAAESFVELIELFGGGSEDVLDTFNSLEHEFGIHLFEDRHN